ncbi:hypothetical protein C4J95_2040 [Pseudomonas orientalis]|uniref:ankyrin repeat domain-containing protein n=1 Tax=Pseudomonas orientalis TaxID=76758 RepID=UPI000F58B72A|nr:ankyrin repeat domain-containing protein [Pseudomonas orientalis]AZE99502.1 hypothetical protein C4J95_2040 [Pseudomonas orientalis]
MNVGDESLDGILQPFREMAIFEGYEIHFPESPGRDGDTPLHVAAFANDVNSLKALMPFVTDINVIAGIGYTPLHYAILHGSAASADFLIANGADVGVEGDYGETPLSMMRSSPIFAEILRSHGLA